jgi:hypothetical protein
MSDAARRGIRRRTYQDWRVYVLVALLSSAVTGCAVRAPGDQITQAYESNSLLAGQPVPLHLLNPDNWVLVKHSRNPGFDESMIWHKVRDRNRPEEWTESFDYLDIGRPNLDIQGLLNFTKQSYAKSCPSGDFSVIAQSRSEYMIERKPCYTAGPADAIDRTALGSREVMYLTYLVRKTDMSDAQRQAGIAALQAWSIAPTK